MIWLFVHSITSTIWSPRFFHFIRVLFLVLVLVPFHYYLIFVLFEMIGYYTFLLLLTSTVHTVHCSVFQFLRSNVDFKVSSTIASSEILHMVRRLIVKYQMCFSQVHSIIYSFRIRHTTYPFVCIPSLFLQIETRISTTMKQKLEMKNKSESSAIETSAGQNFLDNNPLNK